MDPCPSLGRRFVPIQLAICSLQPTRSRQSEAMLNRLDDTSRVFVCCSRTVAPTDPDVSGVYHEQDRAEYQPLVNSYHANSLPYQLVPMSKDYSWGQNRIIWLSLSSRLVCYELTRVRLIMRILSSYINICLLRSSC